MTATDDSAAPEHHPAATAAGGRSAAYPSLVRAVAAAAARAGKVRDPLDRARALTALLAVLGHETTLIAGERDAALAELLASGHHPSHRALSGEMGLSRQRIDQLARHARAGGRPRRP